MIIQWPSLELPLPNRGGFSQSRIEGRKLTTQDAGTFDARRKLSKSGQKVAMILDVDLNQRARFYRFHDIDTSDGSMPFAMAEPAVNGAGIATTDGQRLVMPDGTPLTITSTWLCLFGRTKPQDSVSGVRWKIAFDVMVLPV